ncbi:MAG: DUF99 family protein [Acidilobaceae archaeon]|nr:DUF99 family protein [Acidilobaceae archaeon]MCX8165298.1 DUF99 family protein [Acidilobaceae archaeon]MDW7973724.1 DUF99 family protein [Sulfolobales archaeon]
MVACDDGRVRKGAQFTVLACLLWNAGPQRARFSLVRIDGLEASSIVAALALQLGRGEALLLDSLTSAGFNPISPSTVERVTGLPTVAVYTYEPSSERLRAAMEKHLLDWELRLRVLKEVDKAQRTLTARGELYVYAWGLSLGEAKSLVEGLQIHARVPEPLRLAHMLASDMSRLLSMSAGGGI